MDRGAQAGGSVASQVGREDVEGSGDHMRRAERRRVRELLKLKRRRYWGDYGEDDRPQTGRITGLKLSAPKPTSSCMCCMNQRKLYGPTRQEHLSQLGMKEAGII